MPEADGTDVDVEGESVKQNDEPNASSSTVSSGLENFENSESQTIRCQAETQNGTQCERDAKDGQDYCGRHEKNAKGDHTWKMKRVQMYMFPEDREELSVLQSRVNYETRLDLQNKEFHQALIEFVTTNDDVQDELIDYIEDQFSTDDETTE